MMSLSIADQSRPCHGRPVLKALILLLALGGTSPGYAADPAGKIVMRKAAPNGAGVPQIDGGTSQDLAVWPATLKYYKSGTFSCTSTIVGENTIVTAAHCVVDATELTVELDAGTFPVSCTRHPLFNRATLEADIALCYSAKAFPNTVGFENLDVRSTRVQVGSNLFLLGYGCRDVNAPFDAGQLYGGSAKVFQMAPTPTGHVRTKDGVVICPGDSGGAAYVLAVDDKPVNPRSIVGINSGYIATDRISAITGLSGVIAEFIRDWAADNKTLICGVHPDARPCHDRFSP
ncbi:MAG: hypothetical protein V7632_743 [Bradyrhizobium sp.]|jgi:hypothetical protein